MKRIDGKAIVTERTQMKRAAGISSALAVLALIFVPPMKASQAPGVFHAPSDSMTLWQARQAITEAANYAFVAVGYSVGKVDTGSIRFAPDGFEFDGYSPETGRQRFKVDVKKLESTLTMAVSCKALKCNLRPAPRKFLQGLGWYNPDCPVPGKGYSCSAECVQASGSFTAAVNALHALAIEGRNRAGDFSQRAAAWRSLTAKPPIPEEVRAQRLLAENALKEKRFVAAMSHYDAGLRIYPTWPQGQFNAALISAQLELYAEAIEYMRAYLELAPDAADAQSARDQIVIWQDKAK